LESPWGAPGLPFEFRRPDRGEPLPEEELARFSTGYASFLREIGYFDYLLRHSHGVDPSTGYRPFAGWWSDVEAVREGALVTFRHQDLHEQGGHNVLVPHSKILASALAGSLSLGSASASTLAVRYCQGVTAMMLGMVRDEQDPIRHLMGRNVVTFNHRYTTHDGREKAVDYSHWYSPYSRWNCQRFEYSHNPYWGSVWVTNVRSKDDVGYLFRTVGLMKMAVEQSAVSEVVDACGEALSVLQQFAEDIVEAGYHIRTKDQHGIPFVFSQWEKPPGIRQSDDLDNFVTFDPLFPEAECNNKQASHWIAFGQPDGVECGDGGPNLWERISLENNYPNIGFFRAYHLAHLYQALLSQDYALSHQLLMGFVRRMEEDLEYDTTHVAVHRDRWLADMAPALVVAAAQGYPLTSDEVRLIHRYYRRAWEQLASWPHWDLWDPGLADGVYPVSPPRQSSIEGEEVLYWVGIADLGTLIEYCWSPWKNPHGRSPVHCDALRGLVIRVNRDHPPFPLP